MQLGTVDETTVVRVEAIEGGHHAHGDTRGALIQGVDARRAQMQRAQARDAIWPYGGQTPAWLEGSVARGTRPRCGGCGGGGA